MQRRRNGILIDVPSARKNPRVRTKTVLNDYEKYNSFLTMEGFEDNCKVTVMVPEKHRDVVMLKRRGYVEVEKWMKVRT